jgi:hypothetical protein
MKFNEFEHHYLPHILIPLIGGLFVLCAAQRAARAQPAHAMLGPNSFVVSDADGYGVNDCIMNGDECAKIVADAWCEAHGHGAAKAYGPASDVTGAIHPVAAKVGGSAAPVRVISRDDVFITCGE